MRFQIPFPVHDFSTLFSAAKEVVTYASAPSGFMDNLQRALKTRNASFMNKSFGVRDVRSSAVASNDFRFSSDSLEIGIESAEEVETERKKHEQSNRFFRLIF